MLDLPKVPKVADLVDALVALDARVSHNDARITTLEGRQAADAATLKAQLDRDRWLSKLRRGR